jgi:hypothetical protein
MKIHQLKKLFVIALLSVWSTLSFSQVTFYSDEEGWDANISGSFPVFLVFSDTEDGEQASRIMSGFNPANMTLKVTAPEEEGLVVSGTLQINNHLQGSQVQNSGLFESRIADVQVDGDFGRLNIGKGFGIFNSSAIGDLGSALGVGVLGGGADTGNATGGHIGTGYVYANFNPRIIYSNTVMGSLDYKLGIFNPEEPTDAAGAVETAVPRVEGQVNYRMKGIEVWTGFMWQPVKLEVEDVDYVLQGVDVGARYEAGGARITAAYTVTEGIGADGLYGYGGINDAKVDGSQWYVEGAFTKNKTTYGTSYGVGDQDAHSEPFIVPEIENTLLMLFVHHKMTSHLTLMVELQDFSSETSSVTTNEYQAMSFGSQFDF